MKQRLKQLQEKYEILSIVIPKEEDLYRLYSGLSERVQSETAKKLTSHLASEKLSHKKMLEDFLEEVKAEMDDINKQLGKG